MKKIISMIMVAVMLILSLVSCAYSIADEDISAYATISAENKKLLEAALKDLAIEDGDFTADAEIRNQKVEDALYASIANSVASEEKKTEGKASGHDLVFYSYYCTAKIDEKDVVLFASNMKSGSEGKFQLGILDSTKTLEIELGKLFSDFDFKNNSYKTESPTATTLKEGDVVFVSYKYKEKVKNDEGKEVEKDVTITNEMIVVEKVSDDGVENLAQYLNGQEGNKVDTPKNGVQGVDYTNIKVDWIATGKELGTVKDVTFDEEKKVKDIRGAEYNLEDVELTYHVYPVGYIGVEDYNGRNVIDVILGAQITPNIFYEILFGEKFFDKSETERNKILDKYTTRDADGKKMKLGTLIESIAAAHNDLDSKEKTLKTAKETLEKSKETLETAQKNYDEAAESDKNTKLEALNKAKESVKKAEDAVSTAENNLKQSERDKDEKIRLLLTLENGKMENKVAESYKENVRSNLIDSYNNEIKMNLANEIYFFFEKYVDVKSYPEKAIDTTYDQLIQNYKYDFYKGDFDSSTSNYKKYEGNFKNFLMVEVKELNGGKDVTNYDTALALIRKDAENYVKPVLVMYAIAEAFNLTVTEKEYDKYMDSDNYDANVYQYGENAVRYAYQFDKIMNYFLQDGVTAAVNGEGKVNYNGHITYKFATPASEEAEDEE